MNKLKKFVVPVNVIVFGEDAMDAITYVEEALDNCFFIEEDGIIGAEVLADDIEPHDEDYDDDRSYEEEEN
jgi:hypothetical protein